jgi:xylulose-5-phosphate/fructose-6-phosphate phosphoketolase
MRPVAANGSEPALDRWNAVFEMANRCSTVEIIPIDDYVSPNGRVMEMLSKHQCEGWLEGYLLTGRHDDTLRYGRIE